MSGENELFQPDSPGAPAGHDNPQYDHDLGEELKEDKPLYVIILEADAWQPYLGAGNFDKMAILLPSISIVDAHSACQDHFGSQPLLWTEARRNRKWVAYC